MSCNNPLLAVCLGINPDTGKKILRFEKQFDAKGAIDQKQESFFRLQQRERLEEVYGKENVLDIPCGKCIGCRLKYSRDWANRCLCELQYHKYNYFLTLTYNDDCIPYGCDPKTGEVTAPTLRYRDLQLFWKNLRNNGKDIRFFACSEYGPTTFRPHYHAIVFGLELDDLVHYKTQYLGDQRVDYYTSEFINSCWYDFDLNKSRGYVVIGDVTYRAT